MQVNVTLQCGKYSELFKKLLTHSHTMTPFDTPRKQPFPKQALDFMCLHYKSFENIMGKGEIARNEQFLLFPQCFLPVWSTFYRFLQILNCLLQSLSIWNSLKFVVW